MGMRVINNLESSTKKEIKTQKKNSYQSYDLFHHHQWSGMDSWQKAWDKNGYVYDIQWEKLKGVLKEPSSRAMSWSKRSSTLPFKILPPWLPPSPSQNKKTSHRRLSPIRFQSQFALFLNFLLGEALEGSEKHFALILEFRNNCF